MSYSFSITAASKDEAGKKVEEQLERVVQGQPTHAFDRQAAQDAAEAFIGVLAEPSEGQQISVSMHGSLGWRGASDGNEFTSASVGVSASLVSKT